jgi:hypothetical protein
MINDVAYLSCKQEIKRLLNLDKQDKESDELMKLDMLLADNAFLF